MTKITVHSCHADGCTVSIPPRMFMCARHWRMVPDALKDAVWDAYVEGQEVRKDPTAEYLVVTEAAICAVAMKEGLMTPEQAEVRLADRKANAEFIAEWLPVLSGPRKLPGV